MISPEAHAIIDHATTELLERQQHYKVARDYFDGDHPLKFASDRWTAHIGDLFDELRDNLCPLVVAALIARLKVRGFASEVLHTVGLANDLPVRTGAEPLQDGPLRRRQLDQQTFRGRRLVRAEDTEGEGAAEPGRAMIERRLAEELWSYNRMDAKQREVHQDAALLGDGFVIVWADPDGRACIYRNDPGLIHLEWDPEQPDRKLWAVKRWEQADYIRVNIYYSDRIEKYVSALKAGSNARTRSGKTRPGDWDEYRPAELVDVLDDDDQPTGVREAQALEPWPLPNPFGEVPVFHLRNGGSTGGYGRSELHEIIPLQDALNKEFADLILSSDQYGFPLRYVTGVSPELDEETGKPKPINLEPLKDVLLAVWGEGVTLGQFAAAELAQHIGTINDLRAEIGRISQTPPHMLFLITGEIPSGEALKVVESPFTAKVEDRQTIWGNAWEDVMAFAVLVDTEGTTRVRYSIEWEDAQPKSMAEIAAIGQAWLQLGIPKRFVWKRLLELTDRECDELEAMAEDEAAREPLPPLPPGEEGMLPASAGPPPGRTPPQLRPYAEATRNRRRGGSRGPIPQPRT